ncbi:MAG: type II toxin-antitoxin system Phd/YefM family antitoxin [Calditrichaeota bacterium]|nr:type II toxin-antitoxin system Phd/YefM family antitoxin [Calditrichota bacterium]
MKPSKAIKPISYLKTHASEVVREVFQNRETLVITQNGEAKVVVQDIKVYEEMQDSLALLKMLALSSNSMKKKEFKSIDVSFRDIRAKINEIHNKK